MTKPEENKIGVTVTLSKEEEARIKGEQLTELFFTKVKGWEWKERWETLPPHNYCWHDREDKEVGVELPKIHKSLDLQEEWLWPELRKKYAHLDPLWVATFGETPNGEIDCLMYTGPFIDQVMLLQPKPSPNSKQALKHWG